MTHTHARAADPPLSGFFFYLSIMLAPQGRNQDQGKGTAPANRARREQTRKTESFVPETIEPHRMYGVANLGRAGENG